jgi:hypothetical protein
MIGNHKDAARRKLLGILPRSALEQMSMIERPWMASRGDLIFRSLERWNAEEVKEQVQKITCLSGLAMQIPWVGYAVYPVYTCTLRVHIEGVGDRRVP